MDTALGAVRGTVGMSAVDWKWLLSESAHGRGKMEEVCSSIGGRDHPHIQLPALAMNSRASIGAEGASAPSTVLDSRIHSWSAGRGDQVSAH